MPLGGVIVIASTDCGDTIVMEFDEPASRGICADASVPDADTCAVMVLLLAVDCIFTSPEELASDSFTVMLYLKLVVTP